MLYRRMQNKIGTGNVRSDTLGASRSVSSVMGPLVLGSGAAAASVERADPAWSRAVKAVM